MWKVSFRLISRIKRGIGASTQRSTHRQYGRTGQLGLKDCSTPAVSILATVSLICVTIATNNSTCNIEIQTNDSNKGVIDSKQWNFRYEAFHQEVRQFLEEHQIDADEEECKERAKPWNSYHESKFYPKFILVPETTEQVSKIVSLCHKYEIPIVPFGGGTSLEGHTLSLAGGISLDFNHMKNIVQLNEEDLDITVEAGVGYVELNDMLRDKGLWFPLDPGPGASIGGMCACRCSGSTAVRYGSMRDNVLSLTAVLPDGTIIKTGSRARKSAAGYDLTRLLIGSEGTLAIITEVTLKLHGIPKVSHAVRISFPDGVHAAATTAKDTLNCGVAIGRCELLDRTMVKLINQANPNLPEAWPEHTTLLYEITGISPESVAEQVDVVSGIARKNGGVVLATATDPKDTRALWTIRKECLWSAMSQYPDYEPMITDVCVPLTQLPDLIEETRRSIEGEFAHLPCPIIAHAGDGNFHVLIMFRRAVEKEVKDAKALASQMALRAIALGGTCTGEHGIGVGKKEYLRKEMGPGSMALMELIKRSIDPQGICNPGKIL